MKRVITLLLCCLSLQVVIAQQDYWLSKGKMTISGTSTMHNWESSVNKIWGNASVKVENGALSGINKLIVELDVYSIKSPKGSMMDDNTYKALKAKQFPHIKFELTKVNSIKKAGNDFAVSANGNLTIAGVTKPVEMSVTAKLNTDGSVVFSGKKSVKMTDYKVDPPTFMFGAMTTGDEVTLDFSVTYSK